MKVVIMAGGLGKRIANVDPTIPKPLLPISGKPILQWEIECLVRQGLNEIIITVSHMAEKIQDYFGDGTKFGCKIEYFPEEQPLGNAGALFKLWKNKKLDGDFLLLNADSMFDVDFKRFIAFHEKKRDKEQGNKGQENKGQHNALATLFTHPNNHPYDSTLIVVNPETHVIEQWLTKDDDRPEFYKNCVNAGLHIINTELLAISGIKAEEINAENKIDLDRDVLKPLISSGRIYSYSSPEYVKDMGTPERLEQVKQDLISGKVQSRNLSKPQKAIFLDRDGTINKSVGFLKNIDEFELLPGVTEAIRRINDSGYLCIVVTNQPVVARGEITVEELQEIHNAMETLLGEEGAYIDDLYYCPHHPDKGFTGEIPELKIDCECRKPKPGMLLKAAEDFNIDLSSSWMIGDSERDVQAGKNAGCETALIVHGEEDLKDTQIVPTFYVDNLLETVKLIQVLDRTDLSSVNKDATYLLYNRNFRYPLFYFDKYYNSKRIEVDFSTALAILIKQKNPEDFDLLTLEEYSQTVKNWQQIQQAQQAQQTHSETVHSENVQMNSTIKPYSHYLMVLDEEDKGFCNDFIKSQNVTFDDYLKYLLDSGLKEIEADLLQSFDLKHWINYNDEDMISSMLFKSEVDYQKKIQQINYYNAHGKCAIDVLKRLFSKDRYAKLKNAPRDVRNTYYEILKRILRELEQLVNLHQIKLGNNAQFPATTRVPIHTMSFHNLLRQSIYGFYSFDSFSDYEPANAITVIRQIIELRIRKAIGIMGFKDQDENPVNLPLSTLFEILNKYPDIKYPVKRENIIRIYKWANYYVHSGKSDWSWIPIFIEKYLTDFSLGVVNNKTNSWDYKNSFKISQTTLDKIKQDVKSLKPELTLFECVPECEIL